MYSVQETDPEQLTCFLESSTKRLFQCVFLFDFLWTSD